MFRCSGVPGRTTCHIIYTFLTFVVFAKTQVAMRFRAKNADNVFLPMVLRGRGARAISFFL